MFLVVESLFDVFVSTFVDGMIRFDAGISTNLSSSRMVNVVEKEFYLEYYPGYALFESSICRGRDALDIVISMTVKLEAPSC